MIGYTSEWIGTVKAQTFITSNDDSVDAWADDVRQTIEAIPQQQPFRLMVDVSGPDVSFTAHARKTAQQVMTEVRRRKGRMAYIAGWRTTRYFGMIFVASLGKLDYEVKFLSSRDEAIQWLNAG